MLILILTCKLLIGLEQRWVINWTMYILQRAHRLDLLAFEGKELMQPPWLSQPRKVKSSTQQVERRIELNNYSQKLHLYHRWYSGYWEVVLSHRNGADSFDTLEYLSALSRSEDDLPALVFYSLIGKNGLINLGREKRSLWGKKSSGKELENLLQAMTFVEWLLETWQLCSSSGKMCSRFKSVSKISVPRFDFPVHSNPHYRHLTTWRNTSRLEATLS